MDGYDSAYSEDDIREWRVANNNARLKKAGKCDKCGSTNLKTSKRGNIYCGDLCWTKEKDDEQD